MAPRVYHLAVAVASHSTVIMTDFPDMVFTDLDETWWTIENGTHSVEVIECVHYRGHSTMSPVVRALEGSWAVAHASGAEIEMYQTVCRGCGSVVNNMRKHRAACEPLREHEGQAHE